MLDHHESFPELDAARSLVAAIKAAQPAIEAQRELPLSLAASVADAGMFRLLLPRTNGGSQLTLPKFLRCVETIAEADASTGWCVGQGGVFANVADNLPPGTADAIWGDNPNAVVATGTPMGSRAAVCEGGFRLSGRWRFASGCMHASWLAAMATVVDRDGNSSGGGMFLVPRAEVDVGDGWNVRGLRGTGSRDYALDDQFVPDSRAMHGPVFQAHCGAATGLPSLLLFASAFGAVGLGNARRAIDSFMELAQGKTPVFTNRKLLDDDLVHTGLAQAEALWGSSRAFLIETAHACTAQFAADGVLPQTLRARLRLSATNAMRRSADVVDQIYQLAGTDVIFDDHPIHRCFQDAHALTQQIQGRNAHYRTVGRVMLGLEPDSPIL